MSWTEIIAAERAAYKPITGRLLEKYRLRDRDIRHNVLLGPMVDAFSHGITNGVNEDIWETMGTFNLWVPDYHDGGTTTLKIVAKLTAQNLHVSGESTVKWRLKHGASVSNEITHGQSGNGLFTYDREAFTLTFTPTAGAVNTIDVRGQGTINLSVLTMTFEWNDTHEGILSTV